MLLLSHRTDNYLHCGTPKKSHLCKWATYVFNECSLITVRHLIPRRRSAETLRECGSVETSFQYLLIADSAESTMRLQQQPWQRSSALVEWMCVNFMGHWTAISKIRSCYCARWSGACVWVLCSCAIVQFERRLTVSQLLYIEALMGVLISNITTYSTE